MSNKWLTKFVEKNYGKVLFQSKTPCHVCNKVNDDDNMEHRCSKCLKTVYCSAACQEHDWNVNHHAFVCGSSDDDDDDVNEKEDPDNDRKRKKQKEEEQEQEQVLPPEMLEKVLQMLKRTDLRNTALHSTTAYSLYRELKFRKKIFYFSTAAQVAKAKDILPWIKRVKFFTLEALDRYLFYGPFYPHEVYFATFHDSAQEQYISKETVKKLLGNVRKLSVILKPLRYTRQLQLALITDPELLALMPRLTTLKVLVYTEKWHESFNQLDIAINCPKTLRNLSLTQSFYQSNLRRTYGASFVVSNQQNLEELTLNNLIVFHFADSVFEEQQQQWRIDLPPRLRKLGCSLIRDEDDAVNFYFSPCNVPFIQCNIQDLLRPNVVLEAAMVDTFTRFLAMVPEPESVRHLVIKWYESCATDFPTAIVRRFVNLESLKCRVVDPEDDHMALTNEYELPILPPTLRHLWIEDRRTYAQERPSVIFHINQLALPVLQTCSIYAMGDIVLPRNPGPLFTSCYKLRLISNQIWFRWERFGLTQEETERFFAVELNRNMQVLQISNLEFLNEFVSISLNWIPFARLRKLGIGHAWLRRRISIDNSMTFPFLKRFALLNMKWVAKKKNLQIDLPSKDLVQFVCATPGSAVMQAASELTTEVKVLASVAPKNLDTMYSPFVFYTNGKKLTLSIAPQRPPQEDEWFNIRDINLAAQRPEEDDDE